MDVNQNIHTPVLLTSIMEKIHQEFDTLTGLVAFDGTLGGGGYSSSFLREGIVVYGSDLDLDVVTELSKKYKNKNFEALHGNFSEVIGGFGDGFFDVIVADLGFSSNQLESSNRGFSYLKREEDFDLRYDVTQGKPAWQVICEQPVDNLGKIIYRNSGEKLSFRIARAIKEDEIKTVGEIVDKVVQSIPQKFKNKTKAILSRFWQAMRIEVNREFEHLDSFLQASVFKLKPGGMLMVVSFHSLEDKIVTRFMRQQSKPVSEDEYGNKVYEYQLLTKKPLVSSEGEVEHNIRSRSATLRILKRL